MGFCSFTIFFLINTVPHQLIFYIRLSMSFYLKISNGSKHKKYRCIKDKPINFQQIRRDIAPLMRAESIRYVIINNDSSFNSNPEGSLQRQQSLTKGMNENDLQIFIKKSNITANQTLKVKITEQQNSESEKKEEENESFSIPTTIDRNRSKSEQFYLQTDCIALKTESFEVTEEFMYNSTIEKGNNRSQSQIDGLLEELQANSRKQKKLTVKLGLTNIPNLLKTSKQYILKVRNDF